jgi:hypothetical protein
VTIQFYKRLITELQPVITDVISKWRFHGNYGREKKLLINAIKEYGGFIIAREKTGVPRSTYYQWIKEDETFKEDVYEAKQSFGESMLQIAIDRLKNPDKGKGSDVLLIAVLNAYMSSTFRT